MTDRETDRDNVLRAFCDTIFPAIEGQDDPTDFWRPSGVDLRLDRATAATLAALPESERVALEQLLDALSAHGLAARPPNARERVLAELSQASIDAAIGISRLTRAVLFLAYTSADAQGRNPN